MTHAALTKTCRRCGIDCSNRPRTVDPRGRYYCNECYDKLLRRKRRARGDREGDQVVRHAEARTALGQSELTSPGPPPSPKLNGSRPLPPSVETLGKPEPLDAVLESVSVASNEDFAPSSEVLQQALIDFARLERAADTVSRELDRQASHPLRAATGKVYAAEMEISPPVVAFAGCPHCRRPMSTGAIVCLSCGFNIVSGKLNPDAVDRPRQRTARTGWALPVVTGAIIAAGAIMTASLLWNDPRGYLMLMWASLIAVVAWFIWVLHDARNTQGAQLKIWLVPGYAIAWVYAESRNRYLKTVTFGVAVIVASLTALALHSQHIERVQRTANTHRSP